MSLRMRLRKQAGSSFQTANPEVMTCRYNLAAIQLLSLRCAGFLRFAWDKELPSFRSARRARHVLKLQSNI